MSAAIETIGLDHIVLRVKNIERSIRWYKRVLGCEEERRLPELGLHQLRVGNALIDLVDVASASGKAGGAAPGAKRRNMDHFAVQLRRFDEQALRLYLRRRGVKPGKVERRYGANGHGPSMYITDPDGNTVELKGPPDRDQTEKAASATYPARRKRGASAQRRPARKATGRKTGRRSAAIARGRKTTARSKSGRSGPTTARQRLGASAAKRGVAGKTKAKPKPERTAKSAAKRKPPAKTVKAKTVKVKTVKKRRTTPKRRK